MSDVIYETPTRRFLCEVTVGSKSSWYAKIDVVSSKGTFINDVTQRGWKEESFRDNNIRLWALERDGGGTGEGHKMYVTSVMNDPYQ